MAEQRVQEAKKLGFTTVIMPQVSIAAAEKIKDIRIVGVRSLRDAVNCI